MKNEQSEKNIFSPSMKRKDARAPLWRFEAASVDYGTAVTTMENHVARCLSHDAPELVWALTHPHIYTLGTSGAAADILRKDVPAITTGRGGQVTYHGPGQRVLYPILDLRARTKDLRAYVWALEEWLILTLQDFGIRAERREGRVGLWVTQGAEEQKIAAIGVRVRSWVTFHGAALNIAPDLSYFQGIVPCGLSQFGVTSMAQLLSEISMDDVDQALRRNFDIIF